MRTVVIGLAVALSTLPSPAHPAAVAYRVADIRPGADDSNPRLLQSGGEVVYFQADDGEHGPEPWQSDGTQAGTVMLGDVGPGAAGSGPEDFTPIGDRVFFIIHETDIGVIEGSPPTARRIAQSIPYDQPYDFTAARGQVYFVAVDPGGQREIFATDGTSITPAVDLASGASSDPSDLLDFDGTLVFVADTPGFGREMWRNDGASNFLVKDIFPGFNATGPNGSFPFALTRLGNQILFGANDGVHGHELWTTDLTSTRLLANLREDLGQPVSSDPASFTVIGDRVYFDAYAQDGKRHLYVTDGTEDGTDLLPTPSTARARVAHVDGSVFFGAEVAPGVDALWVTHGTGPGTQIVKRFTPRNPEIAETHPLRIVSLAAAGPFAYLIVHDDTADPPRQLWRTDGTEAGTTVVADFDRRVWEMEAAGAALFFTAEDDAGEELWAITACGDGVVGTAEECDDGNTDAGDCCTPSCRLPDVRTTCDDGNACTTGDVCRDGACAGSALPGCGCGNGVVDPDEECDDGNRVDGDCCSNGCRAAPAGRACGDGDACTEADACDGVGTCGAGPEVSCDDGDVCTLDGCDAARGCLHERVGFAGVQASLSAGVAATPCGPERAMRRLRRHLGAAERFVQRAQTVAARRTPKFLRRSLSRLRKGARALGRAADLTPSCAAGLTARFDEAIARVTCLLDERRQVGR